MTWRRTVLKNIKPSAKEDKEIRSIANKIIKSIKIKDTKLELGGSSAKGTWLKGNHDIDIYVKFNPKRYAGIDISKVLRSKVKEGVVLHGSRDYIQIERDGFTIELIPIMDIKKVENAHNITDISPFHKKFVLKHKKFQNDIRLAKSFAIANACYGAESYIKGFSGYSLEVLTIHYKGFSKLLKAASQWKSKTVIDTLNLHGGEVNLNKSKMHSPLILVDPVQDTRNVTAVLSLEKYLLFKNAAKKFLKKPSPHYFVREEFSLEKLKKKNKGKLICIELKPLEGKRDVVGAKLLKSFEYMKKELESNNFVLKDSGWHWGEDALLWFMLPNTRLSAKVKHYGPQKNSKDRLDNFKKKWKGKRIYTEKSKTYVMKARVYRDPEKLLSDLTENEFVKKRITGILHQKLYK